jgi:hypothetical protein
MHDERDNENISIGKVGTAVIGWLICQLFVSIWWASNVSTRLDQIEANMVQSSEISERLTRVETQLTSLCETLSLLRGELAEMRKQVGYRRN